MKRKALVFTAFLMLTAASVFAQVADGISFSAWGRGAFAPLIVMSDEIDADGNVKKNYQSGNLFAGTGTTKSDYGFEQEFYLTGTFDSIGFQLGLGFDGKAVGGSITQGDYWHNKLGAAIWVKPLGNEWLKVMGGTFNDDTLWGKIGETNDGFEEFVLPHINDKAKGEDAIFTRFGAYYLKDLGFMLSSSPIDGLFIGARVNAPGLWGTSGDLTRLADVFRYIQAGAGYEIPGIGFARIQYLGGYAGNSINKRIQQYIDDTKDDWDGNGVPYDSFAPELRAGYAHGYPARMEAAFALTLVEDLLVDIGLKMYFPVTSEGTLSFPDGKKYDIPYVESSNGFAVSAAASYKFLGDFSITGRIDSAFGSYTRTSKTAKNYYAFGENKVLIIDARLAPVYDLDFAQVGLDFAFQMRGNEIDVDGNPVDPSKAEYRFGVGAFIKRSFPNGHIKAGVTYTTPTIYEDKGMPVTATKMIQIPVIMQYSF